MHPKNSGSVLLYDVHLEIRAILRHFITLGDQWGIVQAHSTLLPIGWEINVLAAFCEFIFEARGETFIQVIILRISTEWRCLFSLVENLADQNPINSNASLASKEHYTGICITSLKEEMLVKTINEVIFNRFHSLLNSFQYKMVPAWWQSQEFPEVGHIKFKQAHHNQWVENAVVSTKLQMPPWFLYQNRRSLLMLLLTII